MSGRFHAHSGLCFSRHGDGGVLVELVPGADPLTGIAAASMRLTASAWASVVSHVSASGESADTHAAALIAHMGDVP